MTNQSNLLLSFSFNDYEGHPQFLISHLNDLLDRYGDDIRLEQHQCGLICVYEGRDTPVDKDEQDEIGSWLRHIRCPQERNKIYLEILESKNKQT